MAATPNRFPDAHHGQTDHASRKEGQHDQQASGVLVGMQGFSYDQWDGLV